MLTISLKKFLLLVLTPALISTLANAQQANFSGIWKLDETKSDMGQFAAIVPLKVIAEQKTDSLLITKTNKTFDGSAEVDMTETISYDGKAVENTIQPGNSKRTAASKWSEDGKTLTITYTIKMEFNGEALDIKGTEVWTMDTEGKTLSLANTSSSSFGENSFKGVYQKAVN